MVLRSLRAFVAVAEEGHITRAAERIGMQQPPLTRLVRALEDELGVLLLRRLPRGVELTEAGRALFEEARAVLLHANSIAETVTRVARGDAGRLAVGFTGSAGFHPFVPCALRTFRAQRPGVQLSLEEAGTTELLDLLLQRKLDVAFVRTPTVDTPGLLLEPLLLEHFVAAVPTTHRLACAKDGTIDLSALASERLILHRRLVGPGLYDTIIAACRQAGFSPAVAEEAPRLPTTLILVGAGIGVSIVPAAMRRMAVDGVAYLRLVGCPGLRAPLELAMRQDTMTAPVAARFRTQVRQMARGWHDPKGD